MLDLGREGGTDLITLGQGIRSTIGGLPVTLGNLNNIT